MKLTETQDAILSFLRTHGETTKEETAESVTGIDSIGYTLFLEAYTTLLLNNLIEITKEHDDDCFQLIDVVRT